MGILIAMISGLLMSVQGVFNTGVTKTTGMWVGNCFVQFTALLAGLAMWWLTDRQSFLKIAEVTPRYILLGGIMGTAITFTVIKSMDMLRPARAVVVIVVAQVAAAYVIELAGLFGVEKTAFDGKKLLGIVLSVIGVMLIK